MASRNIGLSVKWSLVLVYTDTQQCGRTAEQQPKQRARRRTDVSGWAANRNGRLSSDYFLIDTVIPGDRWPAGDYA